MSSHWLSVSFNRIEQFSKFPKLCHASGLIHIFKCGRSELDYLMSAKRVYQVRGLTMATGLGCGKENCLTLSNVLKNKYHI